MMQTHYHIYQQISPVLKKNKLSFKGMYLIGSCAAADQVQGTLQKMHTWRDQMRIREGK